MLTLFVSTRISLQPLSRLSTVYARYSLGASFVLLFKNRSFTL